MLDPPAGNLGNLGGELPNDLEEFFKLAGFAAAQVVGGEQVERDNANACARAPAQKLGNLLGTRAVTDGCVFKHPLFRPAPVTVNNHSDVAG